ncbi:hypothetical protein BFW01_g8623 [Lasiodiplodia theobromae]|nr:hypothetical protein BFW01_g8623 [Lasiodiplodia theobromae]
MSHSTNTSTSQGSNNGKRPASGSGPDGGNGGRGGKRRRQAPTRDNGVEPPSRRLSCPYFKKDPGRLRSNHSCSKPPGFENANRVKEHIYRAHRTLPECPRCFEELETVEQLSNHLREGLCDTLDKEDRPEREAITNEQVEKLKSKKDLKGLSEEDKWRKMYRIIFALDEDAETPSPYFEPSGWYMDKFRAYCGKRLPHLVRMKLEHQLEASLLSMLMATMQQCQEELFTSFIEAEKSGSLENDEDGEDSDAARAFDWNTFQLPSDPLWFTPDYGQPLSGFDPSADLF